MILDHLSPPEQLALQEELRYAIAADDLSQVKMWLDRGAGLDTELTLDGNTPLYISCVKEKWDIASYLLDIGADITLVNHIGNGSFGMALYKFGGGKTDEFKQAQKKLVEKFLHNKDIMPFINRITFFGIRPVQAALIAGYTDVVERMVKLGADIHLFSKEGHSTLLTLAMWRRTEIEKVEKSVDWLIANGGGLNVDSEETDRFKNMLGAETDLFAYISERTRLFNEQQKAQKIKAAISAATNGASGTIKAGRQRLKFGQK